MQLANDGKQLTFEPFEVEAARYAAALLRTERARADGGRESELQRVLAIAAAIFDVDSSDPPERKAWVLRSLQDAPSGDSVEFRSHAALAVPPSTYAPGGKGWAMAHAARAKAARDEPRIAGVRFAIDRRRRRLETLATLSGDERSVRRSSKP
jgi:hypothetical protein